jgi:Gas vesicle protein
MSDELQRFGERRPASTARERGVTPPPQGDTLADVLERVLDKGIVIAGDIQINLMDIELLTIKLRLLVASVDKAKEMGIDWWESDPALNSRSRKESEDNRLLEENRQLRERLERLEQQLGLPGGDRAGGDAADGPERERG